MTRTLFAHWLFFLLSMVWRSALVSFQLQKMRFICERRETAWMPFAVRDPSIASVFFFVAPTKSVYVNRGLVYAKSIKIIRDAVAVRTNANRSEKSLMNEMQRQKRLTSRYSIWSTIEQVKQTFCVCIRTLDVPTVYYVRIVSNARILRTDTGK